MRWKNPQGIESYLRDQRGGSVLYIWGSVWAVRKTLLPRAAPATRKDREAAVDFINYIYIFFVEHIVRTHQCNDSEKSLYKFYD